MHEYRQCFGMGWLPEFPDFRDYTEQHGDVAPALKKATMPKRGKASTLPEKADLRPWCPPIEDQGNLGSCTAHAGVGILEYFERRAFGRHIDASRRFLYRVTRKFAHLEGDSGAFIRSTMGAMAIFGVPPEQYWPYSIPEFDVEPPAFCYAFARKFEALTYFRLDPNGTPSNSILARAKSVIAGGIPAMFGFTVFDSIYNPNNPGEIPFPNPEDRIAGGHAVVAVGYDNKMQIAHPSGHPKTKGAFLIRNSWGGGWGEAGYGYLPYKYVEDGLALDWWCLISSGWINTGNFGPG